MIPVVTVAQMRSIDTQAIKGELATGFSYMLKAAMGVYDVVHRLDINPKTDEIAIVCGKGNNGGDGYAVGRLLLDNGYRVMCYGLVEGELLQGEARQAFDEYTMQKGNYFYIDDIADLDGFGQFSLIIDALLGTGIEGDPKGLYGEVIKLINSANKPVIAIDTPSGLNNDTGLAGNPTVNAQSTVTMGFAKIGQFFYPARCHIGMLSIQNLGYPTEIVEQHNIRTYLPTPHDIKSFIPPRKPWGSKFDHGVVFMLCGSEGMSGSAALAAQGALRSGCGMVHCAVPRSILDVLAAKVTEPVLHAMPQTDEGSVALTAVDSILKMTEKMHAALIGPGISHHPHTSELVQNLVQSLSMPTVLDGDGINAFKGNTNALKKHKGELLITPHKGEWERLFGSVPVNPVELLATISEKAIEYSMTVVFKGAPNIVADNSGNVYMLPVGNSGLATAGSGDVLSGIIVSLLAQGAKPYEAAVAGTALHGFSGEMASEQLSEYSVCAQDIVSFIHQVIRKIVAASAQPIFPQN